MKKVMVGLSGGVDSAVAVIKLQEAGYIVEGMFMRNWDSTLNNDILGNPNPVDEICPQEKDFMDALDTANKLGITLHRVDFVAEYWDRVFQYFLDEYKNNRTPNPDILCNKEIKFDAFLKKANELGCSIIAMGHYARVVHEPEVALLRGKDNAKDQSYFLCQLNKDQLRHTLFPIGNMEKWEVRELARKYNLSVSTKKDSTGVCFIGERDFKRFLENYIPAKPGNMETLDGTVVGLHDGVMYYTIGQRKGLKLGGEGGPWFVLGKDAKRNVLLVGRNEDTSYLISNKAIVSNVNWLGNAFDGERKCTAKFRYRSKDIDVSIRYMNDNEIEVCYPKGAKAVTPGQAAVFYDGDVVLGGATIDRVYFDDELRRY